MFCFARCLISNKELLIIDEPASSAGEQISEMIKVLMKKEWKKKTVITLTHEPKLVQDYDRILVLENQKINESGF